jgi:hypothetical protein
MKIMRAGIAASLLVFLWAGTTPASAAPDTGGFGHHVVQCAQLAGFGGMHNPGMHQGATGWEPDHVCSG